MKRGIIIDWTRVLQIENYCFGKVKSLKYLGIEINSRNGYHEEIRLRIKKLGILMLFCAARNFLYRKLLSNGLK